MIVGIDFDNTLVQYDALLHQCAVERAFIPASLPAQKTSIRDHIRRVHGDDRWTELQGIVYGERITEAPPAPGAREFIAWCRTSSFQVYVVSHKTVFPVLGPTVNLHDAARRWLHATKLIHPETGIRSIEDAYFETTRAAKLSRIGTQRCDLFIDDLPECLEDPTFPAGTRALLFDPNDLLVHWPRSARIRSFAEIPARLSGGAAFWEGA